MAITGMSLSDKVNIFHRVHVSTNLEYFYTITAVF